MKTADILQTAINLVTGDRAATHGDKLVNHANIARLWEAYLTNKVISDVEADIDATFRLTAADAAAMLALFKIARSQNGGFNLDDYIDGAAYCAIAGELAAQEQP